MFLTRFCIVYTDSINIRIFDDIFVDVSFVNNHLCSLDLRYPEKTIKLATEKAGLEGRAEADSWYQVRIFV